jgi:hypothetical protein
MKSDPGVPGVPGRAEVEEKSPLLAVLLAIFPGIFVHGLGNLYAGKSSRAEELMGEEAIGVAAMGISAGLNFLAFQENGHAEHSKGVEKVYGRMSEVSEYLGGGATGIFGTAFFFDSWIKDIMEAPGAVEFHNKEMRRLFDESNRPLGPDPAADLHPGNPSSMKKSPPLKSEQETGYVPPDPAERRAPSGVAPVTTPTVSSPGAGNR